MDQEKLVSRRSHESYHFCQHVWLPYLYVHAAAVWRVYQNNWDRLRVVRGPLDWRVEPVLGRDPWKSLYGSTRIRNLRSLPEPARPALDLDEIFTSSDQDARFADTVRYLQQQKEWWTYFNQAVGRERAEPTDPLRTLSPWEVMEGAASHFEYRCAALAWSTENPLGDSADFERWSLRVGAYRNVYDLCLEFMDPDVAFKTLPMISGLALHTTNPVLFLDHLLQSMSLWPVRRLREWPNRALYAAMTAGIFAKILTVEVDDPEMILELPPDEEPRLILDGPLDEATWAHPLLEGYRSRRRMILESDPEMADFAVLPFYQDRLDYLDTFSSPITMYLIDTVEESGGWAIVPVVDRTSVTPDLLKEVLVHHAAFDAVDELAGRVSSQPHMCPWTGCRFHATRLCRGNFNTPSTGRSPEEECWFPVYLAMAEKEMTTPYVLANPVRYKG